MAQLGIRELTPAFGAEIADLDPRTPLDEETCRILRYQFDTRGVLVFRDLSIDHAFQVYLCKMLIREENVADGGGIDLAAIQAVEDNFYISNKRPQSAAPFGRLQFHSDTMWSAQPFQVLSLYGVDVGQPAVPTTFVSAAHAWATLPGELRSRVEGRTAMHTAGEVRRGDLTDVLLSNVERPPSTVRPIGYRHPRTGQTILYICEQMTERIVDLAPGDSESLLNELFTHLYDPANRWNHEWRKGDLVVWDNLAIQHARPNVRADGPPRTLRKVASPIPALNRDELPTYAPAAQTAAER
jgi:alpha-ketoglutarate-dependent taurine dioxygenase